MKNLIYNLHENSSKNILMTAKEIIEYAKQNKNKLLIIKYAGIPESKIYYVVSNYNGYITAVNLKTEQIIQGFAGIFTIA